MSRAVTKGTTWWPGTNEYVEAMLPHLNEISVSRGGKPLTRGEVKKMIAAPRVGTMISREQVVDGVDRVGRFLALADAKTFNRLARADSAS
jgi:hypothetical protein